MIKSKMKEKDKNLAVKQIVKNKYVPYLRGTFYALHLPLRHEHYGALFPSMKLVAYKKAVFYISRSEYQFLTTRKHWYRVGYYIDEAWSRVVRSCFPHLILQGRHRHAAVAFRVSNTPKCYRFNSKSENKKKHFN